MANTEKLLALKEWARAEHDKQAAGLDSEWDQASWFMKWDCGTTCCLAGHQAMLEGWAPVWASGKFADQAPPGSTTGGVFRGNERESARDVAQESLGLTEYQAVALFDASNMIKDVEEIIDQILAGTFDYGLWITGRAA